MIKNLLMLAASLAVCGALFLGYERHLMASFGAIPFVYESAWLRKTLTDKAFLRLVRSIDNAETDKLKTVDDFDSTVFLAKNLFEEFEMFGEKKYRYKPNIGIYNIIVWNGFTNGRFVTAETPAVTAALERCKIVRLVHYRTDARGFKPAGLASERTGKTVLFLGDSFTEGLYVRPEDTFVSRFGRKLRDEGVDLAPVNMGVNGYSAMEMRWMLERYAPELKASIAVANLFPNDVGLDYFAAIKGAVPDENYARMFRDLAAMRDFCAARGIRFVVSVIPPRAQLVEFSGWAAFQDKVRPWCAEKGVLYLDPRADFMEYGPDKIYFHWDAHFSEGGHARYADFLYRNLIEGKAA